MNINQRVIRALNPLRLPVVPDVYEGSADEYIVFNYADERPCGYADDSPTADETTIQVHHFTRRNPLATKQHIRALLQESGFFIDSVQQFYEKDTKFFHVIVEAWIIGTEKEE